MTIPQPDDSLEKKYIAEGYNVIIGVDEVGRGSWAGPLTVGAFVFSLGQDLNPEVRDSKLLTAKKREDIFLNLQRFQHATFSVSPRLVDRKNILEATRYAIHQIIKRLAFQNALVLIDGYFRDSFDFEHKCIKSGDSKHYSIAAASILAKVVRDNYMREMAIAYPEYGFDHHVGYGTRQHREALEKYGICPIHRMSYKPVAEIEKNN